MSKEVQVKEKNAVDLYQPDTGEIIRSDVKIPYLALAQSVSEIVKAGNAKIGDIYKTSTGEIVGGPEKAVDCIFLHTPIPLWTYQVKPPKKDKYRYHHQEPRNAANDSLPWNFYADEDGNECAKDAPGALEWRRVKTLKVFAILMADIAAAQAEIVKLDLGELPDPNKALTPVCMNFSVTSYDAGKDIVTFAQRAASMKAPLFRYAIGMSDYLESSDDNTYYVWKANTAKVKPVSTDDLPLVKEWVDLFVASRGNLQTQGEDEVI